MNEEDKKRYVASREYTNKLGLKYECSRCGAEPGSPCINWPGGYQRSSVHVDRWWPHRNEPREEKG